MPQRAKEEDGNPDFGKADRVAPDSGTANARRDRIGGLRGQLAAEKELSAKKGTWPPKVRKAVAYMDKNFAQDICLGDVADLVGMDKSSFCRLFKYKTGVTFTNYVNRLRLEEATRLLSASNAYVFHIAHKVGFKNANYFGVLFRKHYGCSPTEYRDCLQPPQG